MIKATSSAISKIMPIIKDKLALPSSFFNDRSNLHNIDRSVLYLPGRSQYVYQQIMENKNVTNSDLKNEITKTFLKTELIQFAAIYFLATSISLPLVIHFIFAASLALIGASLVAKIILLFKAEGAFQNIFSTDTTG